MNPQIEVDSADVLIPFVANGQGLSIIPKSLGARALEKESVITIQTIEKLPTRFVYMVISKVFPKSNATKKFKKEVIASLNK